MDAAKDKHMTAEIMCSLGKLYEMQGRYAEAEEMYKKALNIRIEVLDRGLHDYAKSGIQWQVTCQTCGIGESSFCQICTERKDGTQNNTLMTDLAEKTPPMRHCCVICRVRTAKGVPDCPREGGGKKCFLRTQNKTLTT